jgi:hypothetical protein
MVDNKSGKRISNCAPVIGQRQQPLSEESRPPSNAAVTFLRETDGTLKLS